MKSILIEALRIGSQVREGLIQPDQKYIVTMANDPAAGREIELTAAEYRKRMRAFDGRQDEAVRKEAIDFFSQRVSHVLNSPGFDWKAANGNQDSLMQADLVLNPAELSSLP